MKGGPLRMKGCQPLLGRSKRWLLELSRVTGESFRCQLSDVDVCPMEGFVVLGLALAIHNTSGLTFVITTKILYGSAILLYSYLSKCR